MNRICNVDNRFSKTPAYLYSAVSFVEKNQIQRNINLAGIRGKKTITTNGFCYQLQDGYRGLEGLKGTPKYWKTAKFEMLSKLDNFGAFQFFFTLSCADLRWNSNFSPILLDLGYKLIYSLEKNESDTWVTKIKAKKDEEVAWRDVEEVIENFDESKHELIRGNVVNSTRYFQNRVKQFLSKIVMNKDNPMCVRLYSYKTEFQQRGAGTNFLFFLLNGFCVYKILSFH